MRKNTEGTLPPPNTHTDTDPQTRVTHWLPTVLWRVSARSSPSAAPYTPAPGASPAERGKRSSESKNATTFSSRKITAAGVSLCQVPSEGQAERTATHVYEVRCVCVCVCVWWEEVCVCVRVLCVLPPECSHCWTRGS